MEIIRLAAGELASGDTDCIKINELPDGRFSLVASALSNCEEGGNPESVALVSSEAYGSYDDAEAAGLAWAESHCVTTIHIEVGGETDPVISPSASGAHQGGDTIR